MMAPTAPMLAPTGWLRLSPRLVPMHMTALIGPAALAGAPLLITGGELDLRVIITAAALFVTLLLISGIGLMRFLTTRYRLGPNVDGKEAVEVRRGLVFRSRRSATVERVRSVDTSANLIYRIFGLATLRIDTGDQGRASRRALLIDGVTFPAAAALRLRITRASEGPYAEDSRTDTEAEVHTADVHVIAEMDWSWIRYAPLTMWGIGGVLVVVGTLLRIAGEMKINFLALDILNWLLQRFGPAPLWFNILLGVIGVAVLGVFVSIAMFIENWSRYRLDRSSDREFRLQRGLFVTRSISIEARRMSGVELVEPLLLRMAGGARADAIASGLGSLEDNRRRRKLCPQMPRAHAMRIAAAVMGAENSPTCTRLTSHPVSARHRRIRWGLILTGAPGMIGTGIVFLLNPGSAIFALAAVPLSMSVGALAGWTAFRSLGYARNGSRLVVRAGVFTRRTAAIECADIIGWRISSSPGQRRAGLATLAATTAAGESILKIRDIAIADVVTIAEAAVPGLLRPFAPASATVSTWAPASAQIESAQSQQ